MKIRRDELEALTDGMEHEGAILRLSSVLERSSVPREALCRLAAGMTLQSAQGCEGCAREHLYRLVNLIEAALRGEVFELEHEAERVELENDDRSRHR